MRWLDDFLVVTGATTVLYTLATLHWRLAALPLGVLLVVAGARR